MLAVDLGEESIGPGLLARPVRTVKDHMLHRLKSYGKVSSVGKLTEHFGNLAVEGELLQRSRPVLVHPKGIHMRAKVLN